MHTRQQLNTMLVYKNYHSLICLNNGTCHRLVVMQILASYRQKSVLKLNPVKHLFLFIKLML
jgi:hypothetical protein